ncbi:hypothetical protein BC830DRAFT_1176043 [Chytriomyces sp. MP71]|nr:hypothetical protein BC830DRAFT_1176043 [Chytriomyces sp. MP71]
MGKDFNKDSNSGSRVGTVQPGIRVAIIHLGLILLAYGLVRLSCLMSISGSPTLWAANGLHIASILSARPKQRAVIPIGFLIIAFVGLLSIHDFSIAGLLSAIHTAESLIIAGAMHALSKNYGLDSYEQSADPL